MCTGAVWPCEPSPSRPQPTSRQGATTGAIDFLTRNDGARLSLPSIVAGDLAAGVSLANRGRGEAFLRPF